MMETEVNSSMESAGNEEQSQRMSLLRDHGKRRIQVCFRVTEKAWERLTEIAYLFEMEQSEYAKAVLYRDIGVWTERLDYRKKKKPRR
jgi:histone deacetylase complex regulatory component SIN3